MKEAAQTSQWASGAAYEPYVGRWSRLVAREFLSWLSVPPHKSWLDVGCGTGALSQTILDTTNPAVLQGIDPSPAYIDHARQHISDGRARFDVGDARDLCYESDSFDVVVSGLAFNFVPDALSELLRVTCAEGTVAVYVWDYAGGMQMMRYFWDAAVELDPVALPLDEGRRFPICRESALLDLFTAAGLREVAGRAIDVLTRFRNFDDYWNPFLGGQGPAPSYAMSLSEDQRSELRELLRSRLPIKSDGGIDLIARAWAARGVR